MAADYSELDLTEKFRSTGCFMERDRAFSEKQVELEDFNIQNPYGGRTAVFKGGVAFRESQTIAVGGASGGGETSFYTSAIGTAKQILNSTRILINKADYPGAQLHLEAIYRAGTSGETARSFNMDLYDVTGGNTVPNGTVSGTEQDLARPGGTIQEGEHPRLRGGNILTDLEEGDREYVLRFWSGTDGLFVDLYEARLIVDF